MEIVFLGTSCMMPTKERNPSTVLLRYGGDGILFDCGEGSQKAMNICGIKRTEVRYILLSHFHGDHVGGLLSLIQTIGNEAEHPVLEIHGPKGTKRRMEGGFTFIDLDVSIELRIFEHDDDEPTTIIDTEHFIIKAANLEHSTPCVGYTFIEKDKRRINKVYLGKEGVSDGPHLRELLNGKDITYEGKQISAEKATYVVSGRKVTYLTDTIVCNNGIALAQDADIMICESTFHSKDQDKAAKAMHLTAKDAAFMANNADVKKLVLTHFSQRYKNISDLEEDAQQYFDNVFLVKDYDRITL